MSAANTSKKFYTLDDATQVIPVSKAFLRKHIANGDIPFKRFGSRIFILASWIDEQTGDKKSA